MHSRHHHHPSKNKSYDSESDTDLFNGDRDTDVLWSRTRKHSRYARKKSYDSQETQSSGSHDDAVLGTASSKRRKERHGEEHRKKWSGRKAGVVDNLEHKKRSSDSTDSSKGKTYEDRDSASIDEHKRSYEEHVNRNPSQSDRKSESYDSDYSCGSVKTDSGNSKKDPPKKSKRKSSSDKKFVYDDTGINQDKDIDERGRWESEHIDSEKEHKRRRKYHNRDDKHHNGSRSNHRSSDEYLEERRSRSKSSHRKHRNSSKERN